MKIVCRICRMPVQTCDTSCPSCEAWFGDSKMYRFVLRWKQSVGRERAIEILSKIENMKIRNFALNILDSLFVVKEGLSISEFETYFEQVKQDHLSFPELELAGIEGVVEVLDSYPNDPKQRKITVSRKLGFVKNETKNITKNAPKFDSCKNVPMIDENNSEIVTPNSHRRCENHSRSTQSHDFAVGIDSPIKLTAEHLPALFLCVVPSIILLFWTDSIFYSVVLCLALIIIVMGIFAYIEVLRKKEKIAEIKNDIEKKYGQLEIIVSTVNFCSLGIDFTNNIIVFGVDAYYIEYSFSEIVNVEIIRNESILTSTNRGSQVVGASIGGVVFGGAGAIVGGLSGSSRSKKQIEKLTIRVIVDDVASPIYDIVLFYSKVLHSGKGVDVDSDLIQPFIELADRFNALLMNAMRRADERRYSCHNLQDSPSFGQNPLNLGTPYLL